MDMLVCINLLLNIVLTYIFTRTAPPILHAFVHFYYGYAMKDNDIQSISLGWLRNKALGDVSF